MRKLHVISDVHGDLKALTEALKQADLIVQKPGRGWVKRKDIFILQLGDLSNSMKESKRGDIECLKRVGDWIDLMCIGNHEIPYFDPDNFFKGFYPYEKISEILWELYEAKKIVSSYKHNDILLSHAGLSLPKLIPFTSTTLKLAYEWEHRNFQHSLFRACGRARHGRDKIGGVLWCDFDKEFEPTPFPQIVGHSSGILRWKGNSVCIDTLGVNGLPTVMKVD